MLTSMFSAVSGLNANGTEISVIGNNIANSNTVGFKAERATFEDIMSSSLGAGASGEVGRGAMVANVMPVFTQSSFDTTSNATDLAIDGRGFFVVKDPKSLRMYYTRAGDFIFNKEGLLVNPNDYVVQGWKVDEKTGQPIGDIGNIDISKISSSSKPTSKISLGANLDSTSEPKFVVSDLNNTLVYNDGTEHVITIENGIYTGEALADKLQSKMGISDFTISYDKNTGKFTFNNNTTKDITIKVVQSSATDKNISTITSLLGFKVYDRDNADSDNDETTGVDNITIAKGTKVKSDTYPDLSLKVFKVTDENNVIKFTEDGGTNILTATIATGEYTDEPYADSTGRLITPISKAIEDALNSASTNANLTYKVNYDKTTGKFSIIVSNSGGTDTTVKFYWGDETVNDDPGTDTTAEQLLGFVKKTTDNENDPRVVNSFEVTAPAGGDSDELTSVYAPNSVFDKSTYDYSSSINVYDSLGNPHNVTFYFKKVAENYWEWHAVVNSDEIDGALPDENGNPQPYEVGNGGHFTFNPSGSLRDASGINDLIFNFSGGAKLLQNIVFNPGTPTSKGGTGLDGVTQFASPSTTFSQSQDGNPAGTLTGVKVDKDGVIYGIYSNGEIKPLAKLAIAKFQNPWGLSKEGKNLFAQTVASGDAIVGAAGTGGRGQIVANALEHSNVDIAEEFVKLIMAQRAFQANSRVITTSDQLLLDIVALKR